MNNKRNIGRIKKLAVLAVFLLIIIQMNSCLEMRKTDKEAIKTFAKKGVTLVPHYLQLSSMLMHYVQVGNDSLPTLLFIHGSPGAWDVYEKYMQDAGLVSKFRMISIDRPGFGYTNFGEGYHLEEQGKIIGEFIQKIDNKKGLTIIGHSYGGPLVALLAADYSSNIKQAMILSGAIDPSLEPKEKWRKSFLDAPLKYLMPGAFRPSNSELWYLKTDLYGLTPKLKNITCPMFVLHATNDMLVDVRNVPFLKKECIHTSHFQDTIFKDGNHFIPFNKTAYITCLLMEM